MVHEPIRKTTLVKYADNKLLLVVSVLVFLGLTAATGYRIYRQYSVPKAEEFDWTNRGHSDFHNGIYHSTKAFFAGSSPFAAESVSEFTLARESPPLSPITFVLHYPFTWFTLHVADVLFFAFNISLALVIAWFSLSMNKSRFSAIGFISIASLILMSRPGHVTLFTGYFTFELVIGTLVALHFSKSRPWLSATGMLLASAKPTYIIPLGFLMLWRKDYKAFVIGFLLCTAGVVGGLGWLAYNSSVTEVISGLQHSQDAHVEDETEFPINSWTRVDLPGLVCKLAGWNPGGKMYLAAMFALLMLPGFVIFRVVETESHSGATGLSGWIVMLSMLVGLYHQSYDCILLVVPWVGITFFGDQTLPEVSKPIRFLISLLVAIPAVNYLSTKSAFDKLGIEPLTPLWQSITMINGICLIVALLILLFAAWPRRGTLHEPPAPS